jgi:molecular chaperone DnaK (HSP70)
VGLDAVRQQSMNPKNTIYDAKRFIGKIFEANDHIFEVFVH